MGFWVFLVLNCDKNPASMENQLGVVHMQITATPWKPDSRLIPPSFNKMLFLTTSSAPVSVSSDAEGAPGPADLCHPRD